jgi:hypothetical protein
MKKIIVLLLLTVVLICNTGCNNEQLENANTNSNFLVKSYLVNMVGVWTEISLFQSDTIEFNNQQNIELLKNLYAVDVNGNKHRVSYCFSSSNGYLHYYVKPGRYFLCLILKETGKYTYKTVSIGNDLTEFTKVFESSLPENSFEAW